MKPSILFRVAAVLLLVFTIGHTLGFSQVDPSFGIEPVIRSMQATHFTIQGFDRTYWDFFLGAGFTIGVLYLFAAVLAWQLAGLSRDTLAGMRGVTWGFAAAFAAITIVSWRYLFWIPIVMSALVSVCLAAAAWASAKRTP